MNFPIMTVRQPWAHALVTGAKDVECRTWRTTYRGPVWIHAGTVLDTSVRARELTGITNDELSALPRGAVLGSVRITEIVDEHASPWAAPGCWYWCVDTPHALDVPVAARGRRGLLYPHPTLAALLASAV